VRRTFRKTSMNNSADVLLTGASGFVGSAILRELLRDGFHIRVLVRGTSRYEGLIAPGVQLVEGDLRESSSLGPVCAGCRYFGTD
jgi:dihydroflavonol-4-reductase